MSDSVCPRCGAAVERTQEYCLECGLRQPRGEGAFGRMSARFAARHPALPGDWVLPALLALAVAVLGATAAILVSRSDTGAESIQTATGGNIPVTDTLPTAPEPQTTPTVTTTPSTTKPTKPPPANPAVATWPRGKDGWTIVLLSLPQSGSRAVAEAKARQARQSGLRAVGILDSSRYPSLHSGYYVVFTGVFDSSAEATSALQRARAAFPAAYTRQIVS